MPSSPAPSALGALADRLGLGFALYVATLAGGDPPRTHTAWRLPAGLASLVATLRRRQ